MTNNTERERLTELVKKENWAWGECDAMYADDIVDFILADRKACLERVKKILLSYGFPGVETRKECMEQALAEIERMEK